MAYETDMRMFVQQGAFTVHDWDFSMEGADEAGSFLEQLIIPQSCISSLAEELDVCGIRAGDIFPDLEHLAAEPVQRLM
jgi:hypothetical protein